MRYSADEVAIPEPFEYMDDEDFRPGAEPFYVYDHVEGAWKVDDRYAPPKNPADPF